MVMGFNYRQWLIISVLLAVIAVLGFMEYQHSREKRPESSLPEQTVQLNVSEIKPSTITVPQNFIGRVEAINEADIYPQVSGYIAFIAAKGGDSVKEGDVLLVIEQAPFVAAYDSAEADKFSAQAEMMNAKSNYERLKQAGKEAVSATELENAAASYLNYLGKYKQACANLQQAEIDLEHTVLRAPFSGVVGHIGLSVGDYVSPQGQKLLSVVQYNPIRAVFSITDKEYLQKRKGGLIFEDNEIKLKLSDNKIYDYVGKTEYTANTLDEKTDSLAVYALFENKEHRLLPNAYVGVMVEQVYDNVITIEKPLLVNKENGKYVYVTDDGVLKLKKVKVLNETDSLYVLENNFSASELLVNEQAGSYTVGQKVAINKLKAEEE